MSSPRWRLPDGHLVVPRDAERQVADAMSVWFAAQRRAGRIGQIRPNTSEFAAALESPDFLPDTTVRARATPEGAQVKLGGAGHVPSLSSQEAADRVGCTTSNVTSAIRHGRLLATKHGRDWLITETDLDAWRQHNERAA